MPKTTFIDGDPSQGIQGTKVLAAFLNKIFSHRHDGLDQDGSAPVDYVADTGAANAYVLTLSPALTQNVVGMPVRFKAANANTGASTVNINGLGAVAIKKNVSGALAAGDIKAGQIIEVVYDGTYYQLLARHYNGLAAGAEWSAENASDVELTNTILTLDLGSVTAGQRYFVHARYKVEADAALQCSCKVEKSSGTATIEFTHNNALIADTITYNAAGIEYGNVFGILKITGSGTLVLKLAGAISTSTATALANENELLVIRAM